jgi:RNA polymerase sigma-70 factor (ECF subfamily)
MQEALTVSPEQALVLAAGQGDRAAFAALVAMYQRPVFSLCFRMLGNMSDAEDAAQETFLKAYRALARYDPERSFSTWLLSIAAHYCIDRIRRRPGRELSLDALPPWRSRPADVEDPERSAIAADEAGRIAGLLQLLPPDYRAVLVLRYWHDLGYEEIAAVLGDTESAIKSRLHRARRQLAAVMAEGPTPGETDRPRDAPHPGALMPTVKGGMTACSAWKPAR